MQRRFFRVEHIFALQASIWLYLIVGSLVGHEVGPKRYRLTCGQVVYSDIVSTQAVVRYWVTNDITYFSPWGCWTVGPGVLCSNVVGW